MTLLSVLCAGSMLPSPHVCQQLAAAVSSLLASHAGAFHLCSHKLHTSRCSAETESNSAEAGQPEASTSGEGSDAAAPARKGPVHARHISLDDPELNIFLRHNTEFITDPDRAYAIGHRNAFERLTRQEVRKALAAQRLYLKDAAAAALATGPAGAKQPPMQEQMLSRLSELQEQLSSSR